MQEKFCNNLFKIITIIILFTLLFIQCNDNPTTPNISVPELTTLPISSLTDSSAICGGTINSDNGAAISERGVCWSTNKTPTISDSATNDGAGTGEFISQITEEFILNTTYYVRAYAINSNGVGYGNAVTFKTKEPETGTLKDIDGNTYKTVKIGDQWWMAENLRVTHYNNGDEITNITVDTIWTGLTTEAYCWYNNDRSNAETYGALYNWYAVADSNFAPQGWHVPTDNEYTELEKYLIANGYNWDGTTSGDETGKSLASKKGWYFSEDVGDIGNNMSTNNASGFSALPGGFRNHDGGGFYSMGDFGDWWTSTESGSDYAWNRYLGYNNSELEKSAKRPAKIYKQYGFSVRLIKD